MINKLKYSRENERVVKPSKTEGNAGYDLYIDPQWFDDEYPNGIMFVEVGETVMLPSGIRYVIDQEWYIQIQERGSTGVKAIKYGAGVGDSNYRGILNTIITNSGQKPILFATSNAMKNLNKFYEEQYTIYPVEKGVSQFVILPVPKFDLVEVTIDEILSHESERGEGKLGSSGK